MILFIFIQVCSLEATDLGVLVRIVVIPPYISKCSLPFPALPFPSSFLPSPSAPLFFPLCCMDFETESHSSPGGLKLTCLLFQSFKCWDSEVCDATSDLPVDPFEYRVAKESQHCLKCSSCSGYLRRGFAMLQMSYGILHSSLLPIWLGLNYRFPTFKACLLKVVKQPFVDLHHRHRTSISQSWLVLLSFRVLSIGAIKKKSSSPATWVAETTRYIPLSPETERSLSFSLSWLWWAFLGYFMPSIEHKSFWVKVNCHLLFSMLDFVLKRNVPITQYGLPSCTLETH